MLRRLSLLAAIATTLACAGIASVAWAQTPSIVGIWSETTVNPQTGQPITAVWDQYTADGKLHIRFITGAGTEDYYGVYTLVGGGATLQARIDSFAPTQICTMICSPVTPVMPIGQVMNSPIGFAGPNVLIVGTDHFNRQPG
ncbi:MAG TPA: hypothetical protein VHW60_05185 [Caulobacteraceae bacterium]|jgi:hypothetical protein|nr:hypothetical protein [Caulobacteraceae bacterium]